MPRLRAVVLHCHEPSRLVPFWSAATGLVPVPEDVAALEAGTLEQDESIELHDPLGLLPSMWLTPAPDVESSKGRLHLDLVADHDVLGVLVAAGGAVVREVAEDGERWTVMSDAEGNHVCIVHGW